MARTMKSIDAVTASNLMRDGALMVDIREPGEYANIRIPGSQNVALSRLEGSAIPAAPGQAIVFFCAAGSRTAVNAARLAAKSGTAQAYVMSGGISAWTQAGLPVERGECGTGGGGIISRLFG